MTFLNPPLTAPDDCGLDTKDALEKELEQADGSSCYKLALKLQKAVDAGVLTFTQDGRIVPRTDSTVAEGPDETQFIHAWGHMMRTMGHYIPKQLTLATKYRALLDDAVK